MPSKNAFAGEAAVVHSSWENITASSGYKKMFAIREDPRKKEKIGEHTSVGFTYASFHSWINKCCCDRGFLSFQSLLRNNCFWYLCNYFQLNFRVIPAHIFSNDCICINTMTNGDTIFILKKEKSWVRATNIFETRNTCECRYLCLMLSHDSVNGHASK